MSGGHGQFIPIHFSAIDTSPAWCNFMASAEFATWAILARYIWRSDKPHSLGLHNLYAEGLLSCAVKLDRIQEHFCGNRARASVVRDLKNLEEQGVIERYRSTKPTIYILGRWENKREPGRLKRIRVEWLYAEMYLVDPETTPGEGYSPDPDYP